MLEPPLTVWLFVEVMKTTLNAKSSDLLPELKLEKEFNSKVTLS